MSHARIEEVSDSDLSDPSEGDIDDIDDFVESDILRAINPTSKPTTSQTPQQPQQPTSRLQHPSTSGPQTQQIQPNDIKDYQMLYPLYFDSTRTRAQGRRVPKTLAVTNPLAREIAAACANLRLSPVFEAHRVHPKDWANPGRVRIKITSASQVKNKHHLYILVAKHLQANPTTENSDALRRVRVPGLNAPEDGEAWPRPAVPRGWKMGGLLPAYSAAMTGGGVSENAFKDMMKEMQGGGGGGGGGMPGLPGGITPDMMNMLGGMGGGNPFGGAGGPSEGSSGGGGGAKKNKKGKGRA